MVVHIRSIFLAPMIAALVGTAPVAIFVSVTSSPLVSLAQTEKEQAEEEDVAALREAVSKELRDSIELSRSKACAPDGGGAVEVTISARG